jgi:hypothetical protein
VIAGERSNSDAVYLLNFQIKTRREFMKQYAKKQDVICTLFEYEKMNDIPENERLTYDQYANIPELPESPRKKPYRNINHIEIRVRNLKYHGKIEPRDSSGNNSNLGASSGSGCTTLIVSLLMLIFVLVIFI